MDKNSKQNTIKLNETRQFGKSKRSERYGVQ